MRLALFSDIHSNFHALEAVLGDMARRGADAMVCLGDITQKGPLPKECVDRVRDLGCPIVLGNTDGSFHPDRSPHNYTPRNQSQVETIADFDRHRAALTEADQRWLYSFPMNHTESVEGVRADFFHATPHNNYVLFWPWSTNDELSLLRLAPETRASAFGHNHRPFIRFADGLLVINTGSVGAPYDGDPRPSYALLEAEEGRVSAQIIRVSYDPEPAITAARQLGMRGWELFAHTARTGRFPG